MIILPALFQVNSVNYPGVSRSVRQVEKKWFDLKSMAKRVLTAKKSLTSLNSEDDTNSDVERSLSLRERCNYYKVLSVIGEQSVSSENAEPMDLAFDITESDDGECKRALILANTSRCSAANSYLFYNKHGTKTV